MAKDRTDNGASLEDGSRGDLIDTFRNDITRMTADADGAASAEQKPKGPAWGFDALAIAKEAYRDSVSFMDSSLRKRWESAERQFQGKHPSGSKYHSDAYKARSRLFRPKTRAALRQGEAQAAASFFANEDVAKVTPADPDDMMQSAGASVLNECLKYRLTTPVPRLAVPWFLTLVGGYQDAQKNGVVISKQWWEYRTVEYDEEVEILDEATGRPQTDEKGKPVTTKRVSRKVIVDRPRVDIFPPENVLIDRGASWVDPINSSPYVVLMIPMTIEGVEAKMNSVDRKTGQPVWKKVDRNTLKSSAKENANDPTRSEREGNREDSKDSQIHTEEFQTVWIHENFVRWADEEWVYYTVGDRHILTDPMLVEEAYPHCYPGERPVIMGYSVIETNKAYPTSKTELTAGLQAEANEIVNQRLDNVKLALNKRYLVRRGSQTDLRSIVRNSPGSVTLTNDPEKDVNVLETRDVTASSYQEQDRVNADFDEIAGSFSVGSVATNRRLGETVGGMGLISGAANSLGELDLRVFTETWVQPVLSQVVRLIQHFETDATILARCGKKAQLWKQYKVNTIDDDLLMQDVVVQVDVGIGATDPMQRLQKFQIAAKTLKEIFGETLAPNIQAEEVTKEVMSLVGYRDGRRFFDFEQTLPIVTQLQQQLQELQGKVETKELERESRVEVAKIGAMSRIVAQGIDSDQRAEEAQMAGQGDAEAKRAELALDAQAHAQDMLFDQQKHAQDIQFKREEHGMDMQMKAVDAQAHAAMAQQQVQQNAVMGQQKIEQTRQMGDLKQEQMRQQAALRPNGGAGSAKPAKAAKPAPAAPAAPPQPAPPAPQSYPQPAPQGPDPMEDIARALMMQMQAMQQTAQAVADMVAMMNAPKRIVFGPDGKAVGVETVGGGPNG